MSVAAIWFATAGRSNLRTVAALILLVFSMLLSSCNSGEAQVESELLSAESRLKELETAIQGQTLRNANMIRRYSEILQSQKPELVPLLSELEKEAGLENPMYKSLKNRYEAVKFESAYFKSWTEKADELVAIQTAANPSVYNDALSDTVNVIADLSEGKLARVNAISKEAEQKANGSKDYSAGSQHIGNPHYGSWSHSSGGSFWVWYGQYRFFSSLFGGNRYYYHNWAGNRGYSYYHDVGRGAYTTRAQRSRQSDVQQRAKKQFGSKGRGFTSPYSRTRSGSSGISRASTAQRNSAFKSPYSSSSKSGKYQSSSRTRSSRSSRSSFGGK